jgi:hypothetical protein
MCLDEIKLPIVQQQCQQAMLRPGRWPLPLGGWDEKYMKSKAKPIY